VSGLTISDFKQIKSAVVKGAFSVALPSGMILKNCTVCEKGDSRWVNGPSRQYEAAGVKKYEPLVEFVDKATRDKFSKAVLEAVDAHLVDR
jgi:DNA-binding cell septation regulator SpoVG